MAASKLRLRKSKYRLILHWVLLLFIYVLVQCLLKRVLIPARRCTHMHSEKFLRVAVFLRSLWGFVLQWRVWLESRYSYKIKKSILLYSSSSESKLGENSESSPQKRERGRHKKTEKIVLSQMQKDIIIGTVLGDASIEREKPNHNSRIRFEQEAPGHSEYLLSIYSVFPLPCLNRQVGARGRIKWDLPKNYYS